MALRLIDLITFLISFILKMKATHTVEGHALKFKEAQTHLQGEAAVNWAPSPQLNK